MSDGDNERDQIVWAEMGLVLGGETSKAYKFDTGAGEPLWIPKSQLKGFNYGDGRTSNEVKLQKRVTHVAIPRWLADAKKLSY